MVWIVAGLIALAAAGVCGYLTRRAHGRIRSMEATETLTTAELKELHRAAVEAAGEGVFRHRCEVVGVARPHRNGTLTSELEKVSCVWHKHKITRKYEETERNSDGEERTVTKHEVVAEHTTETAFFLEDGTGKTVIRPAGHDIDRAEKALDRFRPHHGGGQLTIGPLTIGARGSTIGFKEEEWVVRPGTRLYVHGEASDASGGRLAVGAPAERGVFIMSTRSEAELLRGENNRLLGFGIASGTAAVAAAVLLVIGAVNITG
ncbi:GIDE domain-containing protein [Streptomyces sp. TP-A0874]|uniref:GIDE domain-containing protein n=1 Tax=Streptomyces sp. TP-A0874 TaxID=549819 RepID=UPI00085293EC|nr:GIDE domain-containing protein [Streptomyces sp. TP-A0874]